MSRHALTYRFNREAEALLKQWLEQFTDGVGTYGNLRRLISDALRAAWAEGFAAGQKEPAS